MSVSKTTNRGFSKIPTDSPDFVGLASSRNAALDAIDAALGLEVDAASGAIAAKEGVVVITKAGVAAMTLAAPVAGLPTAGGDDGKVLRVVSATAQAHTITTPAAKINGASAIATFAAAIGNGITFVAYNGVWYVSGSTGITLS